MEIITINTPACPIPNTKTTMWQDFCIADAFGVAAVEDTYKNLMWMAYKLEYMIELAFVLNTKCWIHYNGGKTDLCEIYSTLYYRLIDWVRDGGDGQYSEEQIYEFDAAID